MSILVTRPFTELLSKIVDNRGRSCPTSDSGFPLIATNCIKPNSIYPVFENVRYIDETTRRDWFRGHPLPNDLLFVCKGSPGRVAIVPDPVPFCIAQDMVAIRANQDIIDYKYLFYLLRARSTQKKIENMHVGTLIPHFKKGDFGKLSLTFHQSIPEQRSIAGVLEAIDLKIESNRALVTDVEALMQSIFLSSTEGMTPIPLSQTAEFWNGGAFTKNASGSGRVVVRIAELNSGITGSTVFSDSDVPSKNMATSGDILFAWSGSLTLHRWFREDAIVNQHIFKVIPKDPFPPWLVFQLIKKKLREFKGIAADKATTMGHIQRKHLDDPVLVPDQGTVDELNPVMSSLWERCLIAEVESERLMGLRETLSPQLLAGIVRVRDAEEWITNPRAPTSKQGAS
ncbi:MULTISPECIES: restriction endonuclease subunit S [unclassified Rhodococcus (in: high G+C Gram-positive bacteria)]|uniref:restriction endonuclease subunit S n=1 Tax=unclassified Rhodococcus (in: high G+C Gram-positive bacteria) TaxID=192944 RepID=UPI00339A7960